MEQSDKKTFSIGVISLAYSKETNTVTASLLRKGKTLSESSIPFVSPRTDVPLTYKGFSQPDEVLVTISKDDGTVLAQKSTPYVSPFEKKNAGTGWGAIIILAIVAIGYIVSLLRRKV